jgi:hypothetical protein
VTPNERQQANSQIRRRLWFLRERLPDVTHDPVLSAKVRDEKLAYYSRAIAEAHARLLDLEGH